MCADSILPDQEKERIREKLNILLEPWNRGKPYISLSSEDNRLIAQAARSGDPQLKKLAVNVAYAAAYRFFLKSAWERLQNSSVLTREDVQDMIQELFGITLMEKIDSYDPEKADLITFLRLYEKSIFSRMSSRQSGLGSNYYIAVLDRVLEAESQLEKKGIRNPSAHEILMQDKETGHYTRDLSVKTIERVKQKKARSVSLEEFSENGNDPPTDNPGSNPFLSYSAKEERLQIEKALSRIPRRYQDIIKYALTLDLTTPAEENRMLISYVRREIIKDTRCTDDRARTMIEAALNEFRRAMSAVSAVPRRRQGNLGKLSFSGDSLREEMEDIAAALKEDITILD